MLAARGALAAQLAEEVSQISERHRVELNDHLERWVHAVQEPAAGPFPKLAPDNFTDVVVNGRWVSEPDVKVPAQHASTSSMAVNLKVREEMKVGPLLYSPPSTPHLVASSRSMKTKEGVAVKRRRRFELLTSSSDREPATRLQRLTQSRYYEWTSGIMILLNAVFIGWQTQYMAHSAQTSAARNVPLEEDVPAIFLILQGTFATLFIIELIPRWVCDGLFGFFQEVDKWWNALDVIVVAFSFLDLVLHVFLQRREFLGDLSVLRVLRVIRIVRVAKVIRIMKFFRELRLMIFSILRSMKALVWVLMVLAMLFYLFGISFTAATSIALDSTQKWQSPETSDLRRYFGTVDRSFLTLFMAMSGGREWIQFYAALDFLPPAYSYMFLVYVAFALFAVVNIVTGVFVDSALQSNHDDKIVTANEELRVKKDYLRSMQEIFEEMDEDSSGVVSQEMFEQKLADERVVAYFNAMKLDVSEARKLFWLLDYDQSNAISIDEFVMGCYKLQGESRNLDVKLMQCEVHFLQECFVQFSEALNTVHSAVVDLQSRRHL